MLGPGNTGVGGQRRVLRGSVFGLGIAAPVCWSISTSRLLSSRPSAARAGNQYSVGFRIETVNPYLVDPSLRGEDKLGEGYFIKLKTKMPTLFPSGTAVQ